VGAQRSQPQAGLCLRQLQAWIDGMMSTHEL
jgi:hypothetical protein